MSNVPAIPTEVPSYLAKYTGADGVKNLIAEAIGGISGGSVPTIVANSGAFTKKVSGEETIIKFPALTPKGEEHPAAGQPVGQLSVVVLAAKPELDKAYYASAFSPGQEPQSPDCFSEDGVRPDPSSPMPQNSACAGCPQNVFGSGKNAAGEPGKGKACSDRKRLVIFADNSVWKFVVPPASLQAWVAYCRDLGAHGLAPQFVITKIGFDEESKFKLTFSFAGVLGESAVTKLLALKESQEVLDILAGKTSASPAPPAPAKQEEAPKVDEVAVAKAKKEAEKKAKEEAKRKKDEEAAAAKAAEENASLDLGLDLGGESAEQTAKEPEVVANDAGPSDDDLINELGL